MKALFVNCTLKPSSETSHTGALMGRSVHILQEEGIEVETIRPIDYHISHSVNPDDKLSDDWSLLFPKIMESKILVMGSPIWLGERSSVASKFIERLYAHSAETNELDQYTYYNKVGGVVVTGNEDGAKEVSRSLLYALQHMGFVIPPQADAYWVGDAGPGPSYIEEGKENAFTASAIKTMSWNIIHMARLLLSNPIPAEGNIAYK